jgi:hypothetical protein
MQYITITDYLLLPLYLFLFYFIIKRKSIKYAKDGLDKIFVTAFFLHMGGAFLYCMVIQYYYGYGDSFGFYSGGNFLRKLVSTEDNPFSPFFMNGKEFQAKFAMNADSEVALPIGIEVDSNLLVMKTSALFSYLSFNCYLIISLFFSMFSFLGTWGLFKVFNEYNNKKNIKLLAYAVMYLPSICFWGSGLIKDSLCLGATGFIIYYMYKIFVKNKYNIKYILLLPLLLYFLFLLKNYVAIALVISAVFGYVILLISKSKKNPLKLGFIILILLIANVLITIGISSTIKTLLEESKSQIETFKGAYEYASIDDERSMASFTGGDFDPSVGGILLKSPSAIFTTIFRPFLWETRKLIMLFSSLESFLLLLVTLYLLFKTRVIGFFYYIFSDPIIFFAFTFTILLSAIVGFTTFNFGTLVRYRLPMLPFYCFMLLAIYSKHKSNIQLKK